MPSEGGPIAIPTSSPTSSRSGLVTFIIGAFFGLGLSTCSWLLPSTRVTGSGGMGEERILAIPTAPVASSLPSHGMKQKGPHQVNAFFKEYGLSIGNMETPPVWKSGVTRRVVIDVGANDGSDYSIPAVRDAQHVVYAFEPTPTAIGRFLQNAKAAKIDHLVTQIDVIPGQKVDMKKIQETKIDQEKGHIFLIKAAAAAETGNATIIMAPSDQMSYISSSKLNFDFTSKSKKVDIALVKLDDIVQEDVFLLKTDTQGYDNAVFAGAHNLFFKYRVHLATAEFIPKIMDNLKDNASVKFLEFFEEHGFQCFDWSRNNHIPNTRPSHFEGFVESFKHPCADSDNCACQDANCLEFGKWEDLMCINLNE